MPVHCTSPDFPCQHKSPDFFILPDNLLFSPVFSVFLVLLKIRRTKSLHLQALSVSLPAPFFTPLAFCAGLLFPAPRKGLFQGRKKRDPLRGLF
jgi:hypothetical protein